MHSGIKELLHYSAPFSQGLALVLTSLLESNIINHSDRRAYEGIAWFSLAGQLSQDVLPPTCSQPRLSDNATLSCAPYSSILFKLSSMRHVQNLPNTWLSEMVLSWVWTKKKHYFVGFGLCNVSSKMLLRSPGWKLCVCDLSLTPDLHSSWDFVNYVVKGPSSSTLLAMAGPVHQLGCQTRKEN